MAIKSIIRGDINKEYYTKLINVLKEAEQDIELFYKDFLRTYVKRREEIVGEVKRLQIKLSNKENLTDVEKEALIWANNFAQKGMPLTAPKKEALFSRQGLKDKLTTLIREIETGLKFNDHDPVLFAISAQLDLLKNLVYNLIKIKNYDQELTVLRLIASQQIRVKEIIGEELVDLRNIITKS